MSLFYCAYVVESQTITKRLQGNTKMGRMYMSAKELDRLLIIEKVCKKEIKLNRRTQNSGYADSKKGLFLVR